MYSMVCLLFQNIDNVILLSKKKKELMQSSICWSFPSKNTWNISLMDQELSTQEHHQAILLKTMEKRSDINNIKMWKSQKLKLNMCLRETDQTLHERKGKLKRKSNIWINIFIWCTITKLLWINMMNAIEFVHCYRLQNGRLTKMNDSLQNCTI